MPKVLLQIHAYNTRTVFQHYGQLPGSVFSCIMQNISLHLYMLSFFIIPKEKASGDTCLNLCRLCQIVGKKVVGVHSKHVNEPTTEERERKMLLIALINRREKKS